MSSTTMQVFTVRSVAMPTGSRIAAAAFIGASRPLARLMAPRPASRALEAAEVRELARQVAASDPGFASDLYAAAARHEAMDG